MDTKYSTPYAMKGLSPNIAIAWAAVALSAFGVPAEDGESWTMADPVAWSAKPGAVKLKSVDGALEVRHADDGWSGWSVDGFPGIPVTQGDTFELTCDTEALADVSDAAHVGIGAVLRDSNGKVLSWSFALSKARPGHPIKTAFKVPSGVATVRPRIEGYGATGARLRNARAVRTSRGKWHAPAGECAFGNGSLRCAVVDGGLRVEDVRTGRTWNPSIPLLRETETTGLRTNADGVVCAEMLHLERMKRFRVSFMAESDRPEIVVAVEGDGDMPGSLCFPAAFSTRKGDRLIVPLNEGISYPADEPDKIPEQLIAYGGQGLCMPFFGVQDDATGSGWMAILETPDDAALVARRDATTNLWTLGPRWDSQKGRFGYARRIRYVFFDKGGYVAMCKRYRAHAKEIGKFKTFREKVGERPLVDRLLGAVNVWCMGAKDRISIAKEMKAAGIDRFLWSGGGSASDVSFIAGLDNVLVGRYDNYQDVFHPEQIRKLGGKAGWPYNKEAWPHDVVWDSADSNDWRHAWGIKSPDGKWTYCAMMCDRMAPMYARRHVKDDLKSFPYTARFVDTTVAAPWQTCWNPAHPMTRSDSRHWKMELLRILGDEFKLVVGSETGHDAAVPFCDYFEGMLSLGPYRVPDSGRNMEQIWTNVPPRVAKYQVGEAYRLPLWELVYHECVCAHWYWGDYNNKLPAIWWKRDLFNMLYGTMGMYLFNDRQWAENKASFVRSYRLTSPIARATGYSEMLDHIILTPDRTVQQSRFADGTTVTVNFGTAAFVLPDGDMLEAGGHRVRLGAPATRNF